MPEVRLDNLEAEMKRKKVTRHDIVTLLGLSYRTNPGSTANRNGDIQSV